jgi:hypothetical protein
MGLASPRPHDRSLEKSGDPLDDVAVGHRHSDERRTRTRRRSAAERSLTLEDADKPVELSFVYIRV